MEVEDSKVQAERRRMSRVDTAWLRMDSDANLMMIVGVWLMKPAITAEALAARLREKLLRYERFRMHVVRDATGAAHWRHDGEDPADFDLGPHLVVERLKRKRGETARHALQRRVADLAATPLDAALPLWQMHLVQGYEGGSALVARVHHCIGDGIALISVMLSITDGGVDPPIRPRRSARAADDGESDWLNDAVLKPLAGLTGKAAGALEASLAKSFGLLADPQAGLAGMLDNARLGAQAMGDVAALALMPDDSPSRLKGKPSGAKAGRLGRADRARPREGGRQGARLLRQRRAARGRRRCARLAGWRVAAMPARASSCAPWCRSTCGRSPTHGSSATASAWRRWCCRWASPTRSAASSPSTSGCRR
jgi:hypothetical protein